jgi:hypothetical protein
MEDVELEERSLFLDEKITDLFLEIEPRCVMY